MEGTYAKGLVLHKSREQVNTEKSGGQTVQQFKNISHAGERTLRFHTSTAHNIIKKGLDHVDKPRYIKGQE